MMDNKRYAKCFLDYLDKKKKQMKRKEKNVDNHQYNEV